MGTIRFPPKNEYSRLRTFLCAPHWRKRSTRLFPILDASETAEWLVLPTTFLIVSSRPDIFYWEGACTHDLALSNIMIIDLARLQCRDGEGPDGVELSVTWRQDVSVRI